MEDREIVALFLQRDERALARAQEKYGAYCLSIAGRIAPDEAEEAVDDALLGAWNAIPPHRPAELSTFLGKLTRRAALKLRRAANAVGAKYSKGFEDLYMQETEDTIRAGRLCCVEITIDHMTGKIGRELLMERQGGRTGDPART